MKINDLHRAVLRDYADGDFAHLLDEEEIEEPMDLGDCLLSFILIELSDQEGCEGLDDGINRLEKAQDELEAAVRALHRLYAAIEAKLGEGAA